MKVVANRSVAEIVDANKDRKINRDELYAYLKKNNGGNSKISYSLISTGGYDNNHLGKFYALEKRGGLKNLASNFETVLADAKRNNANTYSYDNCTLTDVCKVVYEFDVAYIANLILGSKQWLDFDNSADLKKLSHFMSVPKAN